MPDHPGAKSFPCRAGAAGAASGIAPRVFILFGCDSLLLLLFFHCCFLLLFFQAAFFQLLGFLWLGRTLGQKARLTFPECGVGRGRIPPWREPGFRTARALPPPDRVRLWRNTS